jgi:hypothetical protein
VREAEAISFSFFFFFSRAAMCCFGWVPAVDPCEISSGYFEDRRPASNMDPYVVTSLIAETTILWEPSHSNGKGAAAP